MAPEAATVLVVDDDADILSLVEFALASEGFVVKLAANGREALDRLTDGLPDLILLDMKMPILSGWEFAREYRDLYDHAVPIVVLTAAEDASRRAAEIGAEGWVGKPFDLDNLLGVVRQHTAKRGPRASSPTEAG